MTDPAGFITAATIIVGFGVTVVMFRVQRELWVQYKYPEEPNWLAWADYLVVGAVCLSLVLVVAPLVGLPTVTQRWLDLAAGATVASVILLVGYIPAILAHYRIEIGRERKKQKRLKGEPAERYWVYCTIALSALAMAATIWFRVTSDP